MSTVPVRARALVALAACAIACALVALVALPAMAAKRPAGAEATAKAAKSKLAAKKAKAKRTRLRKRRVRACAGVRTRRFHKAARGSRRAANASRRRARRSRGARAACARKGRMARADKTAPTAAWIAPDAGATVTGLIAPGDCSVSATDKSGVAFVDFVLDGATHRRDPAAPYTCWPETIDSATLSDGVHKLEARAVDTRNNLRIVKREFTVANGQVTDGGSTTTTTTTETATTETTTTTAPPPSGTTIFFEDFESGTFSKWNDVQQAEEGRISIVGSPVYSGARAGRFEVQYGDVWQFGGARAELAYTGNMASEGQIRTYAWKTRFAEDYPYATKWQDILQWKNEGTGSPPIQIAVSGDHVELAAGQQHNWARLWRATFERGKWLDFQVRIKWSSDPSVGWVELWYNGALALPRRPLQGLFPGLKNYLKIGLYRESSIQPTGVVYHDDLSVTAA